MRDLPVTPRVWFVDVVRLIASLQMVNGHTLDAVLLPELKQGRIFDAYNSGRSLVAVCFLLVAGMAFHLSTLARFDRHRATPGAIGRRFRRGLLIIAAGYFITIPWSALEPDPARTALAWQTFYSVGILHSIGAALLVLEAIALASCSAAQVVAASGLIAVAAIALAPLADASLTEGSVHPLLNWLSHAGGSPFPILPWSGYVAAGVVVGAVALPQGGHTAHQVIWRRLAGLTVAAWVIYVLVQRSPWTLLVAVNHPATRPAFSVQKLAVVLVLTLGLSVVCSFIGRLPRLLRILSTETLSIYVIHLVLLFSGGIEIARRVGPTLDVPRGLLLSVGMIALTATAAVGWHRIKQGRTTSATPAAAS